MTFNDRHEPISNSDANKALIAELRRQRNASLGKAKRARETILTLRVKSDSEEAVARRLADRIEALGGKVAR